MNAAVRGMGLEHLDFLCLPSRDAAADKARFVDGFIGRRDF